MNDEEKYKKLSSNSVKFYEKLAKNVVNDKVVKLREQNDNTQLDFEFIRSFVNKETSLLDLGSGTGLMVNKIFPFVKKVTAVELFHEFSKYIEEAENVVVVNEDVQTFQCMEKFDVITMFGVSQYLNSEECRTVYFNIYEMLCSGGIFIVKNQFGVEDDVFISNYSEELGTEYYSEYRYIENEIDKLKELGYESVKKYDIYPPDLNRWENTHFYAIVCKK